VISWCRYVLHEIFLMLDREIFQGPVPVPVPPFSSTSDLSHSRETIPVMTRVEKVVALIKTSNLWPCDTVVSDTETHAAAAPLGFVWEFRTKIWKRRQKLPGRGSLYAGYQLGAQAGGATVQMWKSQVETTRHFSA
jgi:hypothetical protein